MHPKRRARVFTIILVALGLSTAVALALVALKQNINLFFTPTQVKLGQAPKDVSFRVGGLVKAGSVHYASSDLAMQFVVTDTKTDIVVHYAGVLPDLFREGQGVVVQGVSHEPGTVEAQQVLAKHDENYMPREVHDALKAADPQFANHPKSS